jgi:hypothetical protein
MHPGAHALIEHPSFAEKPITDHHRAPHHDQRFLASSCHVPLCGQATLPSSHAMTNAPIREQHTEKSRVQQRSVVGLTHAAPRTSPANRLRTSSHRGVLYKIRHPGSALGAYAIRHAASNIGYQETPSDSAL